MEDSKKIDLEEEMLDYIFRSRLESRELVKEVIMGRKVLTAYERAFEDGIEKGREEGGLIKALKTARKMREKAFSISEIQEITGLSEDQLRENGIV